MLSMHGLGKLNDILYNNTKNSIRNYTDFIAEHNFGAELIRYNRSIASSIAYEPASFKRPPDFVINKNDVFFYIQMKKLSESERENKQRKLIDSIKRSFKNITIGKFVSLSLSEDFNSKDANLFSSFLRESVETLPDNTDLQFPPTGSPKIVYSLYPPNKIELQHLTVGTSGNLEWIETTGEAEQQVKNSLSKAIGAFLWDSDEKNINIIAMEADRYDDIDISQAVFGTEKFLFYRNGSRAWTRHNDGFFNNPNHSQKICAVLALRRISHTLISRYKKTLFINERHLEMIDQVKSVIDIDKILTIKDLPTKR
ncbi:hypothetical protein NSU18_20000 [Paenibacillus sp. FSL H8-0048]|uniref:hypothetical protein n=1 Tax=Paenibacillus sp. FSL H8-0048 TaxID=2954508 RepID=UPI0030F4FFD2